MQKRVTILQLAERTGLHYSTISLALRNDSRINEKTRARIHQAAKEMGYVPDPMLAALSAYRKTHQAPVYHETLAWITTGRKRDEWRQHLHRRNYHMGAAQRASELGYRLEEFWLKEPGITAKRASHILTSRGIRGLIVSPLEYSRGHLSLDWNHFSAVAIGYTLNRPKLHMVSYAHYQAVVTALRQLRKLGHRRMAWVSNRVLDVRVERLWKAGFLSEMEMKPAKWHVPAFSAYPFQRKPFLKWFQKYRPDAIVTINYHVIIEWLEEAGFQVPQDVSIAAVNMLENQPFAGMMEPTEQIGRAALDLISRMIQNGEKGIPEYPYRLLIEGKWKDGKTVIPRAF